MTQHNAFPLRGGPAWPGSNFLGGTLDDGSGQLTDRSKNVQINTADVMEKRKGFTRGLDEQFVGAVCGLHRYTDECGIEYLLVADESQIHIRAPFAIPVFQVSDAYPNDGFSGTTASVDLSRWRDPSLGHRHLVSSLALRVGVIAPQPLVWFKEATSQSYKVASKYKFPNTASTETVDYFIKSTNDDGKGSLRLRVENVGGAIGVALSFINLSGTVLELDAGSLAPTGLAGDLTDFSYNAATRRVKVAIFVDGTGNPVEFDVTLTTVQDADLGQKTMLGLSATAASNVGVEEISSEPV